MQGASTYLPDLYKDPDAALRKIFMGNNCGPVGGNNVMLCRFLVVRWYFGVQLNLNRFRGIACH